MNHLQIHIDPILLAKEVKFTMSASSGNGGQNVNRVATKATLHFHINKSELFTDPQKNTLQEKLKNRINKAGYLVVVNQNSRSAESNKKTAISNLLNLIQLALKPKKVRKKLRVPKSVIQKRLTNKKRNSEKKQLRKKCF